MNSLEIHTLNTILSYIFLFDKPPSLTYNKLVGGFYKDNSKRQINSGKRGICLLKNYV